MNIIGLLNEYVLPSTFKFGFELEGYYNSYNTDFEKFQQFALDTFAGEFGNDSSINIIKMEQEIIIWDESINKAWHHKKKSLSKILPKK